MPRPYRARVFMLGCTRSSLPPMLLKDLSGFENPTGLCVSRGSQQNSEVSETSEFCRFLVPLEDQRQVDAVSKHFVHAHVDGGGPVAVPIHDAGISLEIV